MVYIRETILTDDEKDLLETLQRNSIEPIIGEKKNIFERLQKKEIIEKFTAVPNPYLFKLLNKKIYFILINTSNSWDFSKVKKILLEKWGEILCVYQLIGKEDFLCRLCGNEYLIKRIKDDLKKFYEEMKIFECKDFFFYWKFKVKNELRNVFNSKIPDQLEMIEILQENCRDDGIGYEDKIDLIRNEILLGYTIIRDYEKTDTIKAFVSFDIPLRLPKGQSPRDFINKFLEFQDISKNIISMYKGEGEGFGKYFIEVEFDRFYDYTKWLDKAYAFNKNINSISIVSDARSNEVIEAIKKIDVPIVKGEEIDYYGQIATESYSDILMKLTIPQREKFNKLPDKRKIQILSNYFKIDFIELDFIKDEIFRKTIDVAKDKLLQGMVELEEENLCEPMRIMGRFMEQSFHKFVKNKFDKCIDEGIFENYDQIRQELGLGDLNIENTIFLHQMINILRNWNKKHEDDPIVPLDIVERMGKIVNLRNHCAHRKAKPSVKRPFADAWKDVTVFEDDVINGFYEALYILKVISNLKIEPKTVLEKLDDISSSLRDLKSKNISEIEKSRKVHIMTKKIKNTVEKNHELLKKLDEKSDTFHDDILDYLEQIKKKVIENKKIEDKIKERIIKNIEDVMKEESTFEILMRIPIIPFFVELRRKFGIDLDLDKYIKFLAGPLSQKNEG